MSGLLEGGKSFIAKLITNEKLYLLVGVMIHEFFAKDVEEYDPLTALSFAFAVLPLYLVKSGEHIVLDSHPALPSFMEIVLNYVYFSFLSLRILFILFAYFEDVIEGKNLN